MIVLDSETGELKALVGGRDYGVSQLDHATGPAPAGIVLQALRLHRGDGDRRSTTNGGPVLTPASTVVDEPTTFWYEQQPPWTPADFEDEFKFRPVTLREALAHSMNVPGGEGC